MEVSIYTCLCMCECKVCLWRVYLHVKGHWSACVCSEVFLWTRQSRTVCVDGVCVCKSVKRLVPFNTVHSVSVVVAVHDSLVWSVSLCRPGRVAHCERSITTEDQWLDFSWVRLLLGEVHDLVSATRGEFLFVQQMTGTPSVLKIMPVVGS